MTKKTDNRKSPSALWLFGLLLLLVGFIAATSLALQQIAGIELPGCGPQSACDQAANSVWGKIPGINWPVSFAGAAYFAGMLYLWLASRKGATGFMQWCSRVALLISVFYAIVMIAAGYVCWYCIVVHLVNLGVWLLIFRMPNRKTGPLNGYIGFVFVIVAYSLFLGWQQNRVMNFQIEKGRSDLAESVEQVAQQAITTAPTVNKEKNNAHKDDTSEPDNPARQFFPDGLTGRYLLGSEKAAIRLMLYTDYQCPDCYDIERDIRDVMKDRSDISLSIKHFPMCTACNTHMTNNMHPNACWAARAAEAAGMLKGDAGFFQMHHWIFDRKGGFTTDVLLAQLKTFGYDKDEFLKVMTGEETLKRVQSDIEESIILGLHYTPMVFINGVELKGASLFTPFAVTEAIRLLDEKKLPAKTVFNDLPMLAGDKYIDDWKQQYAFPPLDNLYNWPLGPADHTVTVEMFGDLLDENAAIADGWIRKAIADNGNAQYTFRPYPLDQNCNPQAPKEVYPGSCIATKAVNAAGLLGGLDSYWKMHDWMLAHEGELTESMLDDAAVAAGLDIVALMSVMESTEVRHALKEDAYAGTQMWKKHAFPMIFVNGKFVPRWKVEHARIIERIIKEAESVPLP